MVRRALAIAFVTLAASGCLGTGTRRIDAPCREMKATVVWEMLRDNPGIRMVDVRGPEDLTVEQGPLKHALEIQYSRLSGSLSRLTPYKTTSLVVLGRDGDSGHRACELLRKRGFQWVVFVSGGAQAWFKSGLPPESPDPNGKPAAR